VSASTPGERIDVLDHGYVSLVSRLQAHREGLLQRMPKSLGVAPCGSSEIVILERIVPRSHALWAESRS
jgi:hypothetical protein